MISVFSRDIITQVFEFCTNTEIKIAGECSKLLFNASKDPWIWFTRCLKQWSFLHGNSSEQKDFTNQLDYVFLQPLIAKHPKQLFALHSCDKLIFQKCEPNNNEKILQVTFRGTPGQGNRSVKSNKPFPFTKGNDQPSILQRMQSWLSSLIRPPPIPLCASHELRRPFSFPIKVTDGRHQKEFFDASPRLVAYFEITISSEPDQVISNFEERRQRMVSEELGEQHQAQQTQEELEFAFLDDFQNTRRIQEEAFEAPDFASRLDCIAVGLSDSHFRWEESMPGWDRHSYGYHGDDGGLFHGSGIMKCQYGPRFGYGDVVGCGIDYSEDCEEDSAAIFFTLNGKFLGTAFKGIPSGNYFPTVGVDSKSTVKFNFGEELFTFDLQKYCKKHEQTLRERLPEFTRC